MARHRSDAMSSLLACWLILSYQLCLVNAFSPRAQTHRVYEDQVWMSQPSAAAAAASIQSRTRFDIPASPAVAMNLPANDADDGSIDTAGLPDTPSTEVQPTAAMMAADATALPASKTASSSSDNQAQQSSSSSSVQQAGMFWNPDASWNAWGLGGSDQLNLYGMQQKPTRPSSFSIQISTASSNGSPAKVQISGALNGYGLDLDWQQEDATKLVQAVQDQMTEAMLSVEDIFNDMLVDSTQGIIRSLDALAHGGLLEWQQRLFGGVGGGLRRRLKQSGSGQVDLLRLLVPIGV